MKKMIAALAVLMMLAAACATPEEPVAAVPSAGENETADDASETLDVAEEEADHDEEEADHDEEEADHDEEEADHDEEEADHDEEEADHDEMADDDGGHGENPFEASAEPVIEIEIVMSEFTFDTDTLELPAGENVRLVLINEGFIEHEFRLSNQERVDAHIEAGHADHGDAAGAGEESDEVGDLVMLVPAGETMTVDIAVPSGGDDYSVVACLIPDHYEAGMFMPLVINEA